MSGRFGEIGDRGLAERGELRTLTKASTLGGAMQSELVSRRLRVRAAARFWSSAPRQLAPSRSTLLRPTAPTLHFRRMDRYNHRWRKAKRRSISTRLATAKSRVRNRRITATGLVFLALQVLAPSLAFSASSTLIVTPRSLHFANEVFGVYGEASKPKPVTISNTTKGPPITIADISIGGRNDSDFTVQDPNACIGATLPTGKRCTVEVTFAPTSLGKRIGTLVITLSVGSNPKPLPLSGVGVAGLLQHAPRSLNFGREVLGIVANAKQVALVNKSPVAMSVGSITTSDPAFVASQNCVGQLAAGQSCTVQVFFNPSAKGRHTAKLLVAGGVLRSPNVVPLVGAASQAVPAKMQLQSIPNSDPTNLVIVSPEAENPFNPALYGTSSAQSSQSNVPVTFAVDPDRTELVGVLDVSRNFGWMTVSPSGLKGELGPASTAACLVFIVPGIFTANVTLQAQILPIIAALPQVGMLATALQVNGGGPDPLSAPSVQSALQAAVGAALSKLQSTPLLAKSTRQDHVAASVPKWGAEQSGSGPSISGPTPLADSAVQFQVNDGALTAEWNCVSSGPLFNPSCPVGEGLYGLATVYQVDASKYQSQSAIDDLWSADPTVSTGFDPGTSIILASQSEQNGVSVAINQPVGIFYMPPNVNLFDDLNVANLISMTLDNVLGLNSSTDMSYELPSSASLFEAQLYMCSLGLGVPSANQQADFSVIGSWNASNPVGSAQYFHLQSCAILAAEVASNICDAVPGCSAVIDPQFVAQALTDEDTLLTNLLGPLFARGTFPSQQQFSTALIQFSISFAQDLFNMLEQQAVDQGTQAALDFVLEGLTLPTDVVSAVGTLGNTLGSALDYEPWQAAWVQVGSPSFTGGPAEPPTSGIYVANPGTGYGGKDSILVFPVNANGDAAPIADITGSNTGLFLPVGVALDSSGNVYVENCGSCFGIFGILLGIPNYLTIYPAGTNGNFAPIAVIAGSNTGLLFPEGLALDSSGNIYVSNCGSCATIFGSPLGNDSVTEYAAGSSGNSTPIATIRGPDTGLSAPFGLAVDGKGNLFVSNATGGPNAAGSITVYPPGSNGDAMPMVTLAGNKLQLSSGYGLALDASDDIYVANDGGDDGGTDSVTIYGAGSSGNTAPKAVIAGSNTDLLSPDCLTVAPNGNVYVSNDAIEVKGTDRITVYPTTANGNVMPSAVISGTNTGLISPVGIAVLLSP